MEPRDPGTSGPEALALRATVIVVPLNLLAFALAVYGIRDDPSLREGLPYVAPFALTTIAFLPCYFAYRAYLAATPKLSEASRGRWLRAIGLVPHLILAAWLLVFRSSTGTRHERETPDGSA